ncbi:putative F-box protein At3g25460 [Apium graveolens]|uniref:putative F-box protein At3g25460 n=1 Tax=Apium graveolens TaxID=4045 RepID=UPI003D78D5E9
MVSSSEGNYLPTNLLIDIFCKLGVESLVRCTCVCKTWHHVIKTTSFASIHLNYQKTSSNTNNRYLLHQDYGSCTLLTGFEPLLDANRHSKLYYSPELFETDLNIRDGCQLRVHGMCDGLLCISMDGISDNVFFTAFNSEYRVGDNLYLWNPICRKAKKLPELLISKKYNGFSRKGGVSFGCYDHDYKVIVISTFDSIYDVSIYSLSINFWNIIHTNCYYEDDDIVDFCTVPEPTKLVDGTSYMITDTYRYAPSSIIIPPLVVCFDLRNETINQVRCPEEFYEYRSKFVMEAYGETIAVLGCDDYPPGYLHMWILFRDKFSSKQYLEKKLAIQLQEVGFSVPVGFLNHNKYYMVRTIKFLEAREQLTYFFLYDLESLEVTKYKSLEDYPCHSCVMNSDCVESLFLLNEDSSINPFVHKDMESSCSSVLFTFHKALRKIPPPPN